MAAQKSNPMQNPLFWRWIAESRNQKLCCEVDFPISREVREQIKLIHFFYGEEYRGTIDLSDSVQRLILVRRHQQDYSEELKKVGEERIIWIIGWQSTVGGFNIKCILELHPNGKIVMKNNDGRPT
jgi:hypothetical protein